MFYSYRLFTTQRIGEPRFLIKTFPLYQTGAARLQKRKGLRPQKLYAVDELIGGMSAFYAEYAASLNKSFTVELGSNVDVVADTQSIKQLFAIIVDNAFKYTDENDSIVVSTSTTAKEVCLAVRDTGPGMTQEEADHACERFYRSREARAQTGGSGLGLALAKRIALAHQGSIQLLPYREGLQVVVALPRDPSRR